MIQPYYQDDSTTIYHADCREIMAEIQDVGLILSDPPYGINYRSNHNSSRRGKWAKWVRYENMPGITGDDKPLDPAVLLEMNIPMVLFGGNYCADQLPPTRCWLVWDKRDGITPNNQADCEMAWTNFDKPSRIYRHLWSGIIRAGDENVALSEKLYPHQKPVALMKWIIQYSETTGTIFDPYMGSGTTLRAAKDMGRKAIGIEIEEKYCEIAVKRLAQEVLRL